MTLENKVLPSNLPLKDSGRILKKGNSMTYMKTYEEIHEGIYTAKWVGLIFEEGKEHPDRWLYVYEVLPDGYLKEMNTSSGLGKYVKKKFCSNRIKKIQEEYGLPNRKLTAGEYLEISKKILSRAWNHEWMGHTMGYHFGTWSLAEILGVEESIAISFVSCLENQGFAGFNGLIIVPNEESEKAYKSWEKSTGHKRLETDDMGGWYCRACGKHGDERGPWAKAVPCVDNTNTTD